MLKQVLLILLLASSGYAIEQVPIPIKVVIVTTFEEDNEKPNATGTSDGEAARWIRGYKLDQILPLPAGFHPVRLNKDGVLEVLTGMATARAAASTMALGLDPRFDFSKAYWLLAGIAGVDPEKASMGSAAWAQWVVDGDIANVVDTREIPADWPDGHMPWNMASPADQPGPNIGEVYELNSSLVHWAFDLTREVKIPDSEGMKKFRSHFKNYEAAQKPPFVLLGDNLASANYWQGIKSTEWARRWVGKYTKGKGTFVTTSCEDSGFLQAIRLLGNAGKVDPRRVLILRTGSDYCMPRPGVTSAESLQYGNDRAYMAANEAFESAFVVGRVVVDELLRNWANYQSSVP